MNTQLFEYGTERGSLTFVYSSNRRETKAKLIELRHSNLKSRYCMYDSESARLISSTMSGGIPPTPGYNRKNRPGKPGYAPLS